MIYVALTFTHFRVVSLWRGPFFWPSNAQTRFSGKNDSISLMFIKRFFSLFNFPPLVKPKVLLWKQQPAPGPRRGAAVIALRPRVHASSSVPRAASASHDLHRAPATARPAPRRLPEEVVGDLGVLLVVVEEVRRGAHGADASSVLGPPPPLPDSCGRPPHRQANTRHPDQEDDEGALQGRDRSRRVRSIAIFEFRRSPDRGGFRSAAAVFIALVRFDGRGCSCDGLRGDRSGASFGCFRWFVAVLVAAVGGDRGGAGFGRCRWCIAMLVAVVGGDGGGVGFDRVCSCVVGALALVGDAAGSAVGCGRCRRCAVALVAVVRGRGGGDRGRCRWLPAVSCALVGGSGRSGGPGRFPWRVAALALLAGGDGGESSCRDVCRRVVLWAAVAGRDGGAAGVGRFPRSVAVVVAVVGGDGRRVRLRRFVAAARGGGGVFRTRFRRIYAGGRGDGGGGRVRRRRRLLREPPPPRGALP